MQEKSFDVAHRRFRQSRVEQVLILPSGIDITDVAIPGRTHILTFF
jgi:hypothetical protein